MKKYFSPSEKPKPLLLAHGVISDYILIAATLLQALIIALIYIFNNRSVDQKIFDVIAPDISEAGIRFMQSVSVFGNHLFLIPVSLLFIFYYFIINNKWMCIRTAGVMLSGVLFLFTLKNLVHRGRPASPFIEGITNYGFPSGHAFMSVIFYGLLIWQTATYLKNKRVKYLIILLLLLLIMLIGYSRIYLRVHFTTDVIAGYCFSYIWLILCTRLINKIEMAEKTK
jgi:undecaprenyl-diphosphatase